MHTGKILITLSIFSFLCALPILSFGQTPQTLPPDEAYPSTAPGTIATQAEEETIAPLPPVSGEPKPIPKSLSDGKIREDAQNEKNTSNKPIEDANLSAPNPCAPETYPPGPLKMFIRHVINDWRENNMWPEPFPPADSEPVRSTFETMVQNGWRRQNLLSDFHFEPETGQLNSAGQEKLRWILWEVPEKHRIVYVARTVNPSETAARLNSVQKTASQLLRSGTLPPILESELSPIGWPSMQVDTIQRKFQESTPAPRLKSSTPQTNAP